MRGHSVASNAVRGGPQHVVVLGCLLGLMVSLFAIARSAVEQALYVELVCSAAWCPSNGHEGLFRL